MIDERRAFDIAWGVYVSSRDSDGNFLYKIGDVIRVLYTPKPNWAGVDARDIVQKEMYARHVLFKVVPTESNGGNGVTLERIEE